MRTLPNWRSGKLGVPGASTTRRISPIECDAVSLARNAVQGGPERVGSIGCENACEENRSGKLWHEGDSEDSIKKLKRSVRGLFEAASRKSGQRLGPSWRQHGPNVCSILQVVLSPDWPSG